MCGVTLCIREILKVTIQELSNKRIIQPNMSQVTEEYQKLLNLLLASQWRSKHMGFKINIMQQFVNILRYGHMKDIFIYKQYTLFLGIDTCCSRILCCSKLENPAAMLENTKHCLHYNIFICQLYFQKTLVR